MIVHVLRANALEGAREKSEQGDRALNYYWQPCSVPDPAKLFRTFSRNGEHAVRRQISLRERDRDIDIRLFKWLLFARRAGISEQPARGYTRNAFHRSEIYDDPRSCRRNLVSTRGHPNCQDDRARLAFLIVVASRLMENNDSSAVMGTKIKLLPAVSRDKSR